MKLKYFLRDPELAKLVRVHKIMSLKVKAYIYEIYQTRLVFLLITIPD